MRWKFYPMNSTTSTTQIEYNHHEDYTGSSACQELASHWLKDCLQNHQKCNKSNPEKYLPTRLLSVGSKGTSKIQLHVSAANSLQAQHHYATLSHCWGNINIKKLLKDELSSMIEGISVDELPKTFQDAIELTRNLEIPFLWIDSLCIIQDSTEDWEQESARMESVYKNAVCNIAATAAENGEKGCFVKRNPALAKPCRVRVSAPDFEEVFEFSLESALGKYVVRDAPLNKRAWVMQEQYLSRRVIHCTRFQLLWECAELNASEQYPTGIPRETQHPSRVSRFSNLPFPEEVYGVDRILQEKPEDEAFLLFRGVILWYSLVQNYAARSITDESDKLIAISGLAKDISPLVHNFGPEADYLAGLWSRFLPIQLLWYKMKPVPGKTKSYCAPSWSWASLNGRVDYTRPFSQDQRYMIQVLEAATKLVTTNPMGQVSGGYIRLRGWLQRITLRRAEIVGGGCRVFIGIDIFFDTPVDFTLEWAEWFCLPILLETGGEGVRGLLLEPTKSINNQRMEYRRVGTFCVYDNHEDFGYFNRPTYPVTSEYPTDGRNSAPISEILSEMGTDGNLDASKLAKQAADARELRERESEEEREMGTNLIDKKTDWVESIITII
ncbi:hypothetical protein HYFRA_00013569 [Hymenoscyphus fraxineus]|uniref:Heterokaryon incompatibility domain-containing protein n=1 Tax=Hymenoscyphus fraxineus TaxID=746836 RepID=A0A9N9LBP7_9HELO|nr:hypothetical protein HYFRA_00013569 [Hymenoscyphus fraxineus]